MKKSNNILNKIFNFLTIKSVERKEHICSHGCGGRFYDHTTYRWYWKLIRNIYWRLFGTRNRGRWIYPELIKADLITPIPLTEPTGLYYALKYMKTRNVKED